jgi:hypothetical protein
VDQAPPLDGPACRAADPADREALFCRRQPTAPTPAPSGLLPVEPHSVAELKLDGVRGPLLANKANRGGNTCPVGVKGGCSGQVDGTAGLPPAPEMPRAPRQLRLVPDSDTRSRLTQVVPIVISLKVPLPKQNRCSASQAARPPSRAVQRAESPPATWCAYIALPDRPDFEPC